MDRRAFLTAAVGGLAGLAGCGSSEGTTDGGGETASVTATPAATATPTATPTRTRTPTATPTSTPPERRYRPQLLAVALVSTWSEFGDLTANRIDALRRGRPAVIAFRYRARVPQGTVNFSEGVDIYHDGDRVVRRFRHVDRHVDAAGLHTWEDAMTFATDDWPTGELEATVAVGELQLHRVSDPVATTFEVVSG